MSKWEWRFIEVQLYFGRRGRLWPSKFVEVPSLPSTNLVIRLADVL